MCPNGKRKLVKMFHLHKMKIVFINRIYFLKKMGQSSILFIYFDPFLTIISIIKIEKIVIGLHEI